MQRLPGPPLDRAGPLCPPVGHGYRLWHGCHCHVPPLRALLHHEGARERHGAGPCHGIRDRQAAPGHDPRGECAGKGDGFRISCPPATTRRRKGILDPMTRRRPVGPRPSFSRRTRRRSAGSTIRTLEAAGYHVLVAQDGEEAVTLFTAHAQVVALAIIDVVMPRVGRAGGGGEDAGVGRGCRCCSRAGMARRLP